MRQLLKRMAIGAVALGLAWPQTLEATYQQKRLPLTGCRGYQTSKGTATYTNSFGERNIPDGESLVVEIENVPLPPGTELLVYVHEKEVGTIKLDRRRGGRVVIEPTFRQPAPSLANGSYVVLKLVDGTNIAW